MKMPRGERDRQMEVNASLRWNDRRRKEGERERERERFIVLGLSFTVLVPLTQQIIFTLDFPVQVSACALEQLHK